ncbi:MAG: sodium:alanine symporter family protein [Kiritimatiellae bacterium]|jgi:AGCS family alanine or glycine:cation symporter|nr:sodium:alanine symporter family protein [Kiritimatiellia bacterium]
MQALNDFLSSVSGIVWGVPMVILLFGTHLFLTFRLGFIQRFIGRGIRESVRSNPDDPGDVSPFGALTTSLAATIGVGNIFGVAGAIAAGGPGAVVWMWLTGLFGIATKYSECLLSVKYRVTTPDGRFAGGPMYVLDRALGMKPLAMIFAGFTAIAAFGIGNMVQSNTLSGMIDRVSTGSSLVPHIPVWVSGGLLTVLTALVILGGIKSISRVCSFLVPIMASIYVLGCIILIVGNISELPATIRLILSSAFTGQAAVGGFAGAVLSKTIQMGIARGLFSNEAGMGSSPIVAAAAKNTDPVKQALISATGTFWDTVVICLMTGLVIVGSGEWMGASDKQELSELAFGHLPILGPFILTFGLMTFVLSTILGWSYYGERAAEYLFGSKVIRPYRVLWVIAVMVGSVVQLDLVWNFADVLNALMAVPNLISLLLLSGVVAAETKRYFAAK